MQAEAPSPTSLGYWNAADWVPLEADGSRIGVRFDASLNEAAIRTLLRTTPGLDAAQARTAPVFLGHTVVLDTAAGTSAADAWELCDALLATNSVMSASPLLWAPHQDPYYLTEEILVRWKEGTTDAEREGFYGRSAPVQA